MKTSAPFALRRLIMAMFVASVPWALPAGAQEPELVPVKADPALVIPDSNAPPSTRNKLTPEISYGARLELELQERRNFDLNGARDDHVVLFEPRLRAAASYDPSRDFQAFLDLELSKRFFLDEPVNTDQDTSLDLKQIYLYWLHLWEDRLDLKLGRQKFKDPRKWLYDEDLDAVRPYLRIGGRPSNSPSGGRASGTRT
jgi:hypothetical protein